MAPVGDATLDAAAKICNRHAKRTLPKGWEPGFENCKSVYAQWSKTQEGLKAAERQKQFDADKAAIDAFKGK